MRRGLLGFLILGLALRSIEAQAGCESLITHPQVIATDSALDRIAAIPPVWDDFSVADYPILLVSDTSYKATTPGSACVAVWRRRAPLAVLELAGRPRMSTPLYGFINLDSAGPKAIAGADGVVRSMQRLAPAGIEQLRAMGITRALLLPAPLEYARIGALGAALSQMGVDPVRLQADNAVHEGFHLFVQFPAWLDQARRHAWPGWDTQPDRAAMRQRCYAGSPAVAAAFEAEVTELLSTYDATSSDLRERDLIAAYAHARRFVAARAARQTLLEGVTVEQDGRMISCALAEDLMELEEGVAKWVGNATLVRAGLVTREQQRDSYSGPQPDAFYRSGALQLWVLDGLLGQDAMRRLTASLARSAGPTGDQGGVFAQFERLTRAR